MIPLEEAQAQVLAACRRRTPENVPLLDALGCVLAAPVVATQNIPSFDNTAMDGYAVRATDTVAAPVVLEVVGTLAAGSAFDGEVGPGQALRIMTGAPMPAGADAVVMVERTEPAPGACVRILAATHPGDNVRRSGEDMTHGQTALSAGTALCPAHLGVLASLGSTEVTVYPRLRVGVLSTGDELREGPGALAPGQIRDSNRPMLLALLSEAGCLPADLGIAVDDEPSIETAIRAGLASCDALVTSGGVSVGDFDCVKTVLDRLGTMSWWQVAVKPAKPFAFGMVDGCPVFGLPGNPVSSMVSFEMFARPALRQMTGHEPVHRPRWPAIADRDFRRRPDGKVHLVRSRATVGADGHLHVHPTGAQGSHQLLASAGANAFVVLPDGEGVNAGETVTTLVVGTL